MPTGPAVRVAALLAALAVLAACGGDRHPTTAGRTGAPSPSASRPDRTSVTASATSTAAAAPAGAAGAPAWPAYHHDGGRTGVQRGMPAVGPLRVAWRARLDGAVYASPLLVRGGVIAATEHDSVYFLAGGRVRWHRTLGTPVTSGLPCGNVSPLGVTGTPVYDPATDTVYVAAELAGPVRHRLYALDAATGRVRWSRSLDVAGLAPAVEQQRAALALADGRVFVAFGGLYGDCGDFRGLVVGVNADGSGSPVSYRTPGTEGGIWTPPGPVTAGPGSLLVSVGNGGATSPSDRYDRSDSVLRLATSTLALQSFFAPATWAGDNAHDLDLGSNGPTRVHLRSGTHVVVAGKRGVVYLLADGRLGGVGGDLARLAGCAAYGGSAVSGADVYLPCSDGVRAVRVTSTGLRFRWHARPAGSPVVGGDAVWSLDPRAGTLYALSPSTGAVLRRVAVGATSRFATPALWPDGHVIVPTLDGVVSVAGG